MPLSRGLITAIASICLTHPAIASSRSDAMERCRQFAIESKGTKEEYAKIMGACTASARKGQMKFATGEPPPAIVPAERKSSDTQSEVPSE